MDAGVLRPYDEVYVCGGNPERIHELHFRSALLTWIGCGGVYVGVSAGSVIATRNLENHLGLLDGTLQVHCAPCVAAGRLELPAKTEIRLGNLTATRDFNYVKDTAAGFMAIAD